MRKILLFLPLILILYACPGSWEDGLGTEYMPVYMDRSTLESSVGITEPQPLVTPGKIYYKSNRIYISERYKGVHVLDNTNPEKPVNLKFISAVGCVDMAIKNNILYLDNAVDLVAFDLTKEVAVKRVKNVFPEPIPPDANSIPFEYEHANRASPNLIIVAWTIGK